MTKKSNRLLVAVTSVANTVAVLIFTQRLKESYSLTLIAGAVFTAALLGISPGAL